MKNVYMTPLRYKNFNGQERTTRVHFHLTPMEFTDWMIDNKAEADKLSAAFSEVSEQMEAHPDEDMTASQKLAMLKLVRTVAELSYGRPSDDGETFDKSERQTFIYSAAYDAFRLFLFTNPKELKAFLDTVLNEEVVKEFSTTLGALQAQEEVDKVEAPNQQPAPKKDPKDMTHEELVAAFQARNAGQ